MSCGFFFSKTPLAIGKTIRYHIHLGNCCHHGRLSSFAQHFEIELEIRLVLQVIPLESFIARLT